MDLQEKFDKILQGISQKEAAYVKMAVIGQPGAGKSTLINRLIGKKVAETGPDTDNTTEATEYEYNFQKIVDTPGYATDKFKFEYWKDKFKPQQYDLFIYVFKDKFKTEDELLFDNLKDWNNERQRPIFLVRNHSEDLSEEDKRFIAKDVMSHLKTNEKVYFVDCRYKTGLSDLSEAISKTDFQKVWHERVYKAYKDAKSEYLESSRSDSQEEISFYCKLATANGINPFFGADVAADIAIYFKMFGAIREKYAIDKNDFSKYALPIAKKLLELLTKEGVMILLKNFAGKATARTVLKYIPFAGQAAAAALSYKMASYAGESYDEDCYKFSDEVMEELIQKKMSELTIQ